MHPIRLSDCPKRRCFGLKTRVDPDAPHPGLPAGDQEQAERHDAERDAGADRARGTDGLRLGSLPRCHVGEEKKKRQKKPIKRTYLVRNKGIQILHENNHGSHSDDEIK